MVTTQRVVEGADQATFVAAGLIDASQWFEFMPLPDDEYQFFVKPENAKLLETLAKRLSTNTLDGTQMTEPKPTLIDHLAKAVTGTFPSRSVHEIQAEVQTICVRLTGASEVCEWRSVHNLAQRLIDLAERGMFHASKGRVSEIGAFAMGAHQEREQR